MVSVYVDESIHDRADFICVALVYADEDIQEAVDRALTELEYRPGRDEFKSSMTMAGNERGQMLRDRFQFELMSGCKLALVICARSERKHIGELATGLIAQIAERDGEWPGTVFFDEGIKLAGGGKAGMIQSLRTGCDSRQIGGIQIADCAASVASVLMLAELGFNTKTVDPGDYPSDVPLELAWSLWTSLRYSLAGPSAAAELDEIGYSAEMLPFGLVVTDACSAEVRAAAAKRLGTVWVGCIH